MIITPSPHPLSVGARLLPPFFPNDDCPQKRRYGVCQNYCPKPDPGMRLLLPTGVSTEQVPVDRFCRKSLSLQVEVWVSGAHLEIVADFVAFWADIWMSPPRISLVSFWCLDDSFYYQTFKFIAALEVLLPDSRRLTFSRGAF